MFSQAQTKNTGQNQKTSVISHITQKKIPKNETDVVVFRGGGAGAGAGAGARYLHSR